ncbi:60S ribosomal protein L11-like protein [Tanacetum coccineum]
MTKSTTYTVRPFGIRRNENIACSVTVRGDKAILLRQEAYGMHVTSLRCIISVVMPTDVVRCIHVSLKLWTSSVTQGHPPLLKDTFTTQDRNPGRRQEAYARLSDKEGIEKVLHVSDVKI